MKNKTAEILSILRLFIAGGIASFLGAGAWLFRQLPSTYQVPFAITGLGVSIFVTLMLIGIAARLMRRGD